MCGGNTMSHSLWGSLCNVLEYVGRLQRCLAACRVWCTRLYSDRHPDIQYTPGLGHALTRTSNYYHYQRATTPAFKMLTLFQQFILTKGKQFQQMNCWNNESILKAG